MNKKTHSNKLQKSSGVFLPLGLVLTLLTVYGLFESKTVIKNTIPNSIYASNLDPYEFEQQKDFQIERPKTEKAQAVIKERKADPTNEFTTTKDPEAFESELQAVIDKEEPNPTDTVPVFFDENAGEELEDDSHLLMELVHEVPIYPGCEKGSRKQKKDCFENKVRKFIGRKFNGGLASTLGLSSGKKRIFVKFIITKNGEIKIEDTSAPHIRLEKEGERVVKLLPKMTPGKQNGKEVSVSYMVPITLQVE